MASYHKVPSIKIADPHKCVKMPHNHLWQNENSIYELEDLSSTSNFYRSSGKPWEILFLIWPHLPCYWKAYILPDLHNCFSNYASLSATVVYFIGNCLAIQHLWVKDHVSHFHRRHHTIRAHRRYLGPFLDWIDSPCARLAVIRLLFSDFTQRSIKTSQVTLAAACRA